MNELIKDACYLVEIKRSLPEEAIDQLDRTITKFKEQVMI